MSGGSGDQHDHHRDHLLRRLSRQLQLGSQQLSSHPNLFPSVFLTSASRAAESTLWTKFSLNYIKPATSHRCPAIRHPLWCFDQASCMCKEHREINSEVEGLMHVVAGAHLTQASASRSAWLKARRQSSGPWRRTVLCMTRSRRASHFFCASSWRVTICSHVPSSVQCASQSGDLQDTVGT